MKFINFNQHKNTNNTWNYTWKAWNKQYLQPINAKITSLQDYMIYNCPEYVVFNSPNNENQISLTNGSNPLQKDIVWTVAEREQQVSVFYPTRLNWHQGFYNQSPYGDGVFVFPTDVNGDSYYLINWYEDLSLPDQPFILRYGLKDDQWYIIPQYGVGGSFGTPEVNDYFVLPQDALDFPSGYICILNKQPIDTNNETNVIKQSLNSYLIAPIGNGAYYTLNFFDKDLIAVYTPNDLNSFINNIHINLGHNLRYISPGNIYVKGVRSSDGKGGAFALPNIGVNDKNEIKNLIVDHVNNLWTGGDELVAQTIHHLTKEEIFMDVMYDSYVSQLKRNMIHNFNVFTPEDIPDIKKSGQETISMIQLQLF